MRITNINSTIANAFARLVNAAEMLCALFATPLRRLDFSWAGAPANPTAILPGNPGTAVQVQLLMPGEVSFDGRLFGKDYSSKYLPIVSDRDWQTPGMTRRQTRWGHR